MLRLVASWVVVAALCCGCGRVDYDPARDGAPGRDGGLDASLDRVDGGSLDAAVLDAAVLDAAVLDAAVLDASIDASGSDADAGLMDAGEPDAAPLDAGLDAPIDASAGDAGTCMDALTIGPVSDATLRSVVMAAAMSTPFMAEESDALLFVATSCFDPTDPMPLILALEAHPDPPSHPIHQMHLGGPHPIGGLAETVRSGLDFPGDTAAVLDAFDAWGGAPGRYYTAAFPTLPCAGCEGGISYNYFVYPATGRIGFAIGGWVR